MEFEPMLTPWEKSPLPENFLMMMMMIIIIIMLVPVLAKEKSVHCFPNTRVLSLEQ